MTGPILTVTLNPAIDQTVILGALHPGAVHRAHAARFDAGGKGVNVASCLADWGAQVVATGILGDSNDSVFRALFVSKGILDRFVRVPGNTRTNIKLLHAGNTTDINLPGLSVTPGVLERVDRMIMTHAEAETVVVLAGSVPDGIEDRVYRDLVATLASRGARVVLDTSGMPLRAALAGEVDALPYCIKPNRAELETLVGHPLPTVEDVGRAARDLVGRGVRLVVVSLGKDGALFADAGHTLQASLPLVSGVSTVGAGDAMVSGIVAALIGGVALEDVARLSTAFAVAKLGQKGPNLPSRGAVEASARDVCVIPRP